MSRLSPFEKRSRTLKTRHYPRDILMEAIDFTLQDLRDNRIGVLGDRQAARLRNLRWLWTGGVILALLLMPIFCAPLIEKLITSALAQESPFSPSLVVYLITAGASIAFLWWTMRGLSRVNADLNAQSIAVIEGPTSVESSRGRHRLVIGDLRMDVHPRIASVFAEGGVYRLYLAPESRVLVGAERLR